MGWRVEFEPAARKALRKIDRTWQERIIAYLEEVSSLDDPRVRGKALTADFAGLWRYRVGDYRVVCTFENDVLVIVVIKIAHRRQVYD
ncbi:MAG TPA: type II toxin-antitoxin system RelE/ParE family toxin [Thermomicrobiales bacterium]|nr:type II toxin-antitoxin system RelE/ParE family toxin [Thermomicrobiales bacterium]